MVLFLPWLQTIIVLALVAAMKAKREQAEEGVPKAPRGRLATKATLIVVPKHLPMQWKGEVRLSHLPSLSDHID